MEAVKTQPTIYTIIHMHKGSLHFVTPLPMYGSNFPIVHADTRPFQNHVLGAKKQTNFSISCTQWCPIVIQHNSAMLHDTFVQSAPTVMVIHAYSNISQPSLGRSNHYLICLNFVLQPTPTDHHHGSPVYSKPLRTHMHTISCYTFSQL